MPSKISVIKKKSVPKKDKKTIIKKNLLKKGGENKELNKDSSIQLTNLIKKYQTSTNKNSVTNKIKLLINKNTVNARYNNGSTPLFFAIENDLNEIINLLIKNGANIYTQNINGFTPLMIAVEKENYEITELLINKFKENSQKNNRKVDYINIINEGGLSALMIAIYQKNIKIIKLLLEGGADINKKNLSNNTALMFAAKENQLEICKLLIEKGANIYNQNIYDETPLIYAVKSGNLDIVNLLLLNLKNNKNNNIKYINTINNNFGRSALMIAAEENKLEIAKLLIEKGANVNLQNEDSETALMIAIQKKNKDIIKLLIEEGANVNLEKLKLNNTINKNIINLLPRKKTIISSILNIFRKKNKKNNKIKIF